MAGLGIAITATAVVNKMYIFTGKDTILRYVDLTIHLQSLSKEAYLYYKSRNAYISTYGDEFIEPAPVFTNIDGGLGIFMGFSQDTRATRANRENLF